MSGSSPWTSTSRPPACSRYQRRTRFFARILLRPTPQSSRRAHASSLLGFVPSPGARLLLPVPSARRPPRASRASSAPAPARVLVFSPSLVPVPVPVGAQSPFVARTPTPLGWVPRRRAFVWTLDWTGRHGAERTTPRGGPCVPRREPPRCSVRCPSKRRLPCGAVPPACSL